MLLVASSELSFRKTETPIRTILLRGVLLFGPVQNKSRDIYACRFGPPDFLSEITDHLTSDCSILVHFKSVRNFEFCLATK